MNCLMIFWAEILLPEDATFVQLGQFSVKWPNCLPLLGDLQIVFDTILSPSIVDKGGQNWS